MTLINKHITIDARAEAIFGNLIDPTQFGVLNTNFAVKSHWPSPLGGPEFEFDYHVAGLVISGETRVREYHYPERFVTETIGNLDSRWEWTLAPNWQSTNVALSVNYQLPGGLLGMLIGRLGVDQHYDYTLTELLSKLKTVTEGAAAA